MTREEAHFNLGNISGNDIEEDFHWIRKLINQIYNHHETAIEILMKANEEEISRHFNECEKYEAQLKTKDEEIERLKAENKKYMEHITLKHLSEPIVFCASCSEKVIMLKDSK